MICNLQHTCNRYLLMMPLLRALLLCCSSVTLAFSSSGAGQAEVASTPPHLVLIVADDLGWNDVPWNNPSVVAPHLAQLAQGGVILNNSYVQPICTPTRTALLASRYPFTVGRQNNVIYHLQPTGLTVNATLLPQRLKHLGYDTHIVGKWHLGFCKWDYTPTSRGFDSFYGFYTGDEDYYTHETQESYEESTDAITQEATTVAKGYDFRDNKTVDWSVQGNYSAFVFSSWVERLLTDRDSANPLFLYVPFQSVHAPLQVPKKYSDLYSYINDTKRRTYLGMVTAMDEAIGSIIASLKSTGHYNNSVIVFTTDNGGPTVSGGNNWPLRGNKTSLWEGGTRGAALVHSPLLSNPGTVSTRMIHATDWYPTFLHLANGKSLLDSIDGVNQWEALNNDSLEDARDYFVYDIDHTNGLRAAVRWNRYKLIIGDPGPGEWTPPPTFVSDQIRMSGNLFPIIKNILRIDRENLHETLAEENAINAKENCSDNAECYIQENLINGISTSQRSVKPRHFSFVENAIDYLSKIKTSIQSLFDGNLYMGLNVIDAFDKVRPLKPKLNKKFQYQQKKQQLKNILGLGLRIQDFQSASDILNSKLQLQLYDLQVDPTERTDVSHIHLDIVKILLTRLYEEFSRYVSKDSPPPDSKSDPKYFNGTWSPGWC